MKTTIGSPTDFLRALGSDAVSIQEGWDRMYDVELQRFERSAPALAALLGDAAADLMPTRTLLSEQRFDVRIRFTKEQRFGASVGVRVLNHAEDLIYARSASAHEHDSRLRVTITQVPAYSKGPLRRE